MANTTTATLLSAALSYAEQGLKIIPLKPRGKTPLTTHGVKDASMISPTIKEWWKRWPNANIGIACDGLLVADIDKHAALDLLKDKGELPATWIIKTGGGTEQEPKDQGYHYVYRVPTDLNIRPGAGKYGIDGLDMRANDSYIVAAPSITRLPYETINASAIAAAPGWLVELAKGEIKGNGAKPSRPVSELKDGQRHTDLISFIGKWRARGFSEDEIQTQALALNANSAKPLTENEVLNMVAQYEHQSAPKNTNYKEAIKPEAVNINTPPENKHIPHLFEIDGYGPFLAKGQHTTVFSQGGSGKSLTCCDYLPLLLCNGVPDSVFSPLGNGNVLICDWETDEEVHRRFISAIKRGVQSRVHEALDIGVIHYLSFTDALPAHAEHIRQYTEDNKIDLLVIDSQMASMAGAFGSMKDEEKAGIYYNILSSFKTTTLTIDHVPKSVMNNDNASGAAFGSVAKYNRARSVFEIKQSQEPGEDFIEVAFCHTKNNLGPKLKPFGLKISFINDADNDLYKIFFDTFDLAESAKLEKVRPLWERIKEALLYDMTPPASASQIGAFLNTDTAVIRTTLNRYDKVFIQVEKNREGGLWGLKKNEA